jgi:predicted Fe-Mo cluster-binding NifX family protein
MYFVVADTNSGEYEAVDNTQNLQAVQGAGVQAAQTVAKLGANVVITGHCGPKAFQVLNNAGIKVYTGAEGTVQWALDEWKAGKYREADEADVESHW